MMIGLTKFLMRLLSVLLLIPLLLIMMDTKAIKPVQDFIDAEQYDISSLEPNIKNYYTFDDKLYSMPKPDNREDNVHRLQDAVQDTIENFREAKDYLNEFGDEISESEKEQILEKNERRKKSISGFREEIKDEAKHQREK